MRLGEKQLLERIRIRDERAFGVLYDRFRPKVYTYALRISGSSEVAEDIVHEVFLKIWKCTEPEKIDNLDAYLSVVTRNFTLKWLRRTILERTAVKEIKNNWDEADFSTVHSVDFKEMQEVIDRAVALLPPQRRLVFQLCKHEGLKYEEVAARTNLSQLTVKTHMQLALRFLRHYVAKYRNPILLLLAISSLGAQFFFA